MITLQTQRIFTILAFALSFFIHASHHLQPDFQENIPSEISQTRFHQHTPSSWSSTLSAYLEKKHSVLFTCLVVLFLGIFMSLTPCIYPMIPITIGIIQSQASSSILRNFSLALSYTCGIATTFACFGLLAAYTGQLFGALMYNPFVILLFCILLVYLGFSMLGFYNMYMPSWLQPKQTTIKGGSCAAAFIFGMISGTVSSPCISPGLIVLLGMVSHLQNALLGFLILFIFGFGLSLPLLIIGTFSTTLSLIPQAGIWMVRIKQLMGIALLVTAAYFFYTAFYTRYFSNRQQMAVPSIWMTDFAYAQDRAHAENKQIVLKIYTPVCNLCSAIDRKILNVPAVQKILMQHFIPVKLDATDTAHQELLKKYTIVGAPALLLLDPSGEEFMRWTGELYDSTPEAFVEELQLFL
ncbi:MAG TPA: cytochrome c biogenesis protein CcdA [Candidatus Bathyarchaeia archaeon]|nr:cytochrome c biogenesis protein CcdA [Candidatus Bathyarchaeia archaeon]